MLFIYFLFRSIIEFRKRALAYSGGKKKSEYNTNYKYLEIVERVHLKIAELLKKIEYFPIDVKKIYCWFIIGINSVNEIKEKKIMFYMLKIFIIIFIF